MEDIHTESESVFDGAESADVRDDVSEGAAAPDADAQRAGDAADIEGAIEAMLFVTSEPVSMLALAEMLAEPPARVEDALHAMRERFARERRGIELREVAGGWRLFTNPAYDGLIRKYVLTWDTRKLSAAALETLAIIAYLQPITRSGVAEVRGVNSESPMSSLVEKGLICESGTADTPGNPALYVTTRTFLERFGLRSAADLPAIEQFAPDEETRRLIASRLSDARSDAEVGDDEASLMMAERLDAAFEDAAGAADAESARAALGEALADAFGTVEKIDFASLEFDFDDE